MVDRVFSRLRSGYERRLLRVMNYRRLVVIVAAIISRAALPLSGDAKELAPTEDQGVVFMQIKAPQYANLEYSRRSRTSSTRSSRACRIRQFLCHHGRVRSTSASPLLLKPWSQRKRTQEGVYQELQGKVSRTRASKSSRSSSRRCRAAAGRRCSSSSDHGRLSNPRARAGAAPDGCDAQRQFLLRLLRSEIRQSADRGEDRHAKSNELGITMQSIGTALATMFGGNFTNFFNLYGRSYQ